MSVHFGSSRNLAVLVFEERGKPGYPDKILSEQGENQQQTQTIYDAGPGNRNRATLVGGECSHHCATPGKKSVAESVELDCKSNDPDVKIQIQIFQSNALFIHQVTFYLIYREICMSP